MTLYDPAQVMERYQVTPQEFIDVKAIMGDPSDNIPGVKGIGEKGAVRLISTYKSLENIYEHLDDLPPGQRKKLEAARELAFLSRELSTILTDVPVEVAAETAALPADLNQTEAYAVLSRYSLNALIRKLELQPSGDGTEPAESGEKAAFRLLQPAAGVTVEFLKKKVLEAAAPAADVYVDLLCDETGDFKRLSIGLPDGTALVAEAPEQDLIELFRALCELELTLVGYDVKNWFRAVDIRPRGVVFDVCSAAYILNQLQGSNTTLSMLYNQQFGALSDLADPAEALGALRLLAAEQRKQIAERQLEVLANEIDMPLAVVIGRMEQAGFRVDRRVLDELAEQFSTEIATLEGEIFELSGHEFNINSPKQLGVVLYEEMGLPTGRKSASKQFSTDNDEMERLRPFHPVIEKIVDYRQLTKLKSTFVDALSGYIQEDQRIHCSFNQNLTATGRLSSSDPNLQNIPVRQERGREIRKAFVAAPGCLLIDADYSQIELRLLAHLSEDSAMIEAFRNHQDIHAATATGLFGVAPDRLTTDMRATAKTVNFSIIYGISDFGLAKDLGITVKEAKQYIEGYYRQYPGVKAYLEEQIRLAKERGYADTLYKRRRLIPELRARNYNVRMFGERVAMNSPVQGTAADIMRLAMVRVERELAAAGLQTRIISQVHDELILEAPLAEVEAASEILRRGMEEVAELKVPLEVSMGVGENWFDIK